LPGGALAAPLPARRRRSGQARSQQEHVPHAAEHADDGAARRTSRMTIFRDDIVLLLPHLRAFACSLTSGDRHLADDLVQDTLVNALHAQHQFTPGTNLKAWLFTILRNRFRSVIGRKHVTAEVHVEDLDQQRSTPAVQEVGIEVAAFRRAFGRLSVTHREALVLTVVQGLSYEHASRIFGCEVGTVKSRVNRARELLQKMLLDDEAPTAGRAKPAQSPVAATAKVPFGHAAADLVLASHTGGEPL
jgi:RNA polymerase sigma-70 factor (ECF subfamily)